jgi:hypothetical protein
VITAPRPEYEAPQPQQRPVFEVPQQRPVFEVPPQQRPAFEVPLQQRPAFEAPPQQQPAFEAPPEQRPTFEVPLARPAIDAFGYGSGTQQQVTSDDTTEMPIFRQMEAVWFRGSDAPPAAPRTAAPRTAAVPPSYVPPAATPPPVPPTPPPPSNPPPQRHRTNPDEGWRTDADTGWRAAQAASTPKDGGTTRSGLPKRVPAAQLVPGAVDARSTTARTKRTPDEVRGLLSAYHRGVQRGRTGGEGTSLGPRSDTEETH